MGAIARWGMGLGVESWCNRDGGRPRRSWYRHWSVSRTPTGWEGFAIAFRDRVGGSMGEPTRSLPLHAFSEHLTNSFQLERTQPPL